MTQQEEREKRFDENWDILSDIVNTYGDTKAKIYLKSFILEEIDLALANREKEIVKNIYKLPLYAIRKEIGVTSPEDITHTSTIPVNLVGVCVEDIINLIKSK